MFLKIPFFSKREKILTVLDIGSSKISCLIAKLQNYESQKFLYGRTYKSEILGFGVCYYNSQDNFFQDNSHFHDTISIETAIRRAVGSAETQAGLIVESVIVNFSSICLKNIHMKVTLPLEKREVQKKDIQELLIQALQENFKQNHQQDSRILHIMPIKYQIDDKNYNLEPIGMIGNRLSADIQMIKVNLLALRNLESCVNRSHLSVEAFVFSAYASGLSVLTQDEACYGAICIDFGEKFVDISIFSNNRFLYGASFAFGGRKLTQKIAYEFSLSFKEAEYLKTRFGSLLEKDRDDYRYISSKKDLTFDSASISYQKLHDFIFYYNQRILHLIKNHLNFIHKDILKDKSVILTGGGSQFPGLVDFYKKNLNLEVRMGRPLGIGGLNLEAKTPAFSTLVGLLIYPQTNFREEQFLRIQNHKNKLLKRDRLGKISRWLQENF